MMAGFAVPLSARRDWHLKPVGPYVVEMLAPHHPAIPPFQPMWFDVLDEAAAFFADECLPARSGWVAAFGCVSTVSLLGGWMATQEVLDSNFGEPRFYALRAGIEALERTGKVNMIDMAIWESMAKRVALGVKW